MSGRIRSREEIIASISQTTTSTKGRKYSVYSAYCGMSAGGKSIRIVRKSKTECVRAVNEWFAAQSSNGGAARQLTPAQIADAVICYDALERANLPLSLFAAVEAYVKAAAQGIVKINVLDAYNEYYSSFGELQVTTRAIIKKRLLPFAESVKDLNVCEITARDVLRFLSSLRGRDGGECAAKTWNMTMTDIRTFFNWCCKKVRRYCAENPISDLEKKPEAHTIAEFASVEAVKALFDYVSKMDDAQRDTTLCRITMSYFLGIRSDEILRTPKEDIKIDEDTVFIRSPKGFQKGVAHRVIPLNDAARAWFGAVDFSKVDFSDTNYISRVGKIRQIVERQSGVKFPHNSGRHSFATYHVAAYGDITKTATILGNSPSICRKNYQGLATKAEGERYFSIRP